MIRSAFVFLLSTVVSLGGCAGVDFRSVKDWSSDTAGARYYMPEPYFLIKKAQPNPVRIDTSASKSIRITNGSSITLLIGKLVGLGITEKIDLQLSPNGFLVFESNSSNKVQVNADQSRNVSVKIKLTTAPPASPATLSIKATYKGVKLGERTLVLTKNVANPNVGDIKSTGTSVGAIGYETSVVYLPNPTRIIAVEPYNGVGGNVEMSLKLKDGWMLTEVGAKSDTQADETITASTSLIEKLAAALPSLMALSTGDGASQAAKARPESEDLTGLYRPIFDEKGYLKGIQRVRLDPTPSE